MSADDFAELKNPKYVNRIARWEGVGMAAVEADLAVNNGATYAGSADWQALALKWLKFKKAQPVS